MCTSIRYGYDRRGEEGRKEGGREEEGEGEGYDREGQRREREGVETGRGGIGREGKDALCFLLDAASILHAASARRAALILKADMQAPFER